jgi:hypothetical protein
MANKLSVEKKAAAVAMLCEGNSIRSIERMTGIHRDGYRHALRWLANNRAGNSVAIAIDDDTYRLAELKVACTRITAPGDASGLRAALADLHAELTLVDAELNLWFPHVLREQPSVKWKRLR